MYILYTYFITFHVLRHSNDFKRGNWTSPNSMEFSTGRSSTEFVGELSPCEMIERYIHSCPIVRLLYLFLFHHFPKTYQTRSIDHRMIVMVIKQYHPQ